jgi:RNA polymerase-binding transcription factor DksA
MRAVAAPHALAPVVLSGSNMDYDTLEGFRRRLHLRRVSLLERRRQALADEAELLAEREPDWEDAAAAQSAATVLDSLGESERVGLERIRRALARIADGSYGECLACGDAIEDERLRTIPETDRCARCAPPH